MIPIKGKYNEAIIYANIVGEKTMAQVMDICNMDCYKDNMIRIMPDCHAGAGCVIGTTMKLANDCITPNMVGVDIGCGMSFQRVGGPIDLDVIDCRIRKYVPAGMCVHETPVSFMRHRIQELLSELRCIKHVSLNRAELSVGSLGGGNHFLELAQGLNDTAFFIVHSGSRYLGKQIAEYYQEQAVKQHSVTLQEREDLVAKLKAEGRQTEIAGALKSLAQKRPRYAAELLWVSGSLFEDYLHDIAIAQEYASINRQAIINTICTQTGLLRDDEIHETVHNYIDVEQMIMRKGAVSAKAGETLLVPMNMRDGSLLCVGKGNPDWNYSAPHGAGRRLSRGAAKAAITLEQFQRSMEGIFTTSVSKETIDEAPDAYKPMEEIVAAIEDTVEITDILKPVYNFKAGE